MRILCASDSFKGSLTSEEIIGLVCEAAAEVSNDIEVDGLLTADGGEGTVKAVVKAKSGKIIKFPVHGPLMEKVTAEYGVISDDTAIMEMASASGLPLVAPDKRNPLYTSSYGTGELLCEILHKDYKKIYVAIGGSATNDGGMGFAEALGVRFLDNAGNELQGTGENLSKVATIDTTGIEPLLDKAEISVMSDVTNPLCGPDGATYTFGPQKGGTKEILDSLENGMINYRDIIRREFSTDPDEIKGGGAAGGLGTALSVFCKARMKSGIDTVLDLMDFDRHIKAADLVITGEGCTDFQSSFGKVVQGVGDRAKLYHVPVIAISGSIGKGYEKIYEHGVTSVITTVNAPMTIDEAVKRAPELYKDAAVRALRLFIAH